MSVSMSYDDNIVFVGVGYTFDYSQWHKVILK